MIICCIECGLRWCRGIHLYARALYAFWSAARSWIGAASDRINEGLSGTDCKLARQNQWELDLWEGC